MDFVLSFATSLSSIIFRAWLGNNPVSAALAAAVTAGRPGLGNALAQRRLDREQDRVAEAIAEKLSEYIGVEFGGLPENEIIATVDAAKITLEKGDINARTIVSADLEPAQLNRELLSADASRPFRTGLGEGGTQLYYLLVEEACNYLIEMASLLPDFNTETTRKMLSRESSVLDIVNTMMANLPRPAMLGGNATEDQLFRSEYMRAVNRHLDRLELFGLDLPARSTRYNLSIAYISLSASIDNGSHASGAQDEGINEILQQHERILIRGQAGSGKTTLLRWLAVNLAQEKLGEDLNALRQLTPFYLPLRNFAGGPLPTPNDFLAPVARNIADIAPTGWVTRVLSAGKGLILIDGIDELPEEQRADAKRWIEDLIADFSNSHIIITSRPPAVDEGWDELPGFQMADLEPMSPAQVDGFIDHWHKAAAGDSLLESFARRLKTIIKASAALRSLSTTPLLCAMLCALHREQQAHLPRDKMEIYNIALGMLLERRDRQRRVDDDLDQPLTRREKQLILRSLAYWFVKNGYSDRSVSEVESAIGLSLRSLAYITDSPERILRHILTRSGVIYLPAYDRVSFIHKTFQEYLAAEEAVDQQDFGVMLDNAHRDQWREVVVLACGHAALPQREFLINELLKRGDEDPRHQHRLHLLAVACLETSETLSERVRERIAGALEKLIPPTSIAEAADVASAGDLAVPLLAPQHRGPLNAAVPSARALAMIGTPSALAALEAYGADRRRRVTLARELMRDWDYFDTHEYANRVLSKSILDRGAIRVDSEAKLAAARGLQNLKSIQASLSESSDLLVYERQEHLRSLDVEDLVGATSLEFLADATSLQELSLGSAEMLETLDGLGSLPSLRAVSIRTAPRLSALSSISSAESLVSLYIDGAPSLGLVDGPFPSSLEKVRLSGCSLPEDLDVALESCSLERLDLVSCVGHLTLDRADTQRLQYVAVDGGSSTRDALDSWPMNLSALRNANGLRSLVLKAVRVDDLSFFPSTAPLESIDLSHSYVGFSLEDLIPYSGSLRTLVIQGMPGEVDVRALAYFSNLEVVIGAGTLTAENLQFLLAHTAVKIGVDREVYRRFLTLLPPDAKEPMDRVLAFPRSISFDLAHGRSVVNFAGTRVALNSMANVLHPQQSRVHATRPVRRAGRRPGT